MSGADVVAPSRCATLHDGVIRANGVVNVRGFAPRFEVADHDFRCAHAGLDFRDLPGEPGGGKRWILPRPDVVERPSDAHIDAVAHRTQGEAFLRELAQAIRI